MVLSSAAVRLACLGLAVPVVLVTAAPAAASCLPSEARVSPVAAAPGQAVTVSSETWFGICNDTGQQVDVTDRAEVTFVQRDQRVVLGRTSSDANGVFRLAVRIPERAATGPAVLEVRGRSASDDVALTVTLPRTGADGAPVVLLALVALGATAAAGRRVVREG